jgi:preprotein translocase subunit SecG
VSAFITIIHIVICIILIVVVLLQSGKAADLAGAFGGVGSQTAFGPRGTATLLSKITTISAVLFMLTSIGLWMLSAKGQRSVVKGEPAAKTAATATVPAAKPGAPAETPAQQPGEKQATAQPGTQPSTQAPAPPAASPKTEPQKKESTPPKKPN